MLTQIPAQLFMVSIVSQQCLRKIKKTTQKQNKSNAALTFTLSLCFISLCCKLYCNFLFSFWKICTACTHAGVLLHVVPALFFTIQIARIILLALLLPQALTAWCHRSHWDASPWQSESGKADDEPVEQPVDQMWITDQTSSSCCSMRTITVHHHKCTFPRPLPASTQEDSSKVIKPAGSGQQWRWRVIRLRAEKLRILLLSVSENSERAREERTPDTWIIEKRHGFGGSGFQRPNDVQSQIEEKSRESQLRDRQTKIRNRSTAKDYWPLWQWNL